MFSCIARSLWYGSFAKKNTIQAMMWTEYWQEIVILITAVVLSFAWQGWSSRRLNREDGGAMATMVRSIMETEFRESRRELQEGLRVNREDGRFIQQAELQPLDVARAAVRPCTARTRGERERVRAASHPRAEGLCLPQHATRAQHAHTHATASPRGQHGVTLG